MTQIKFDAVDRDSSVDKVEQILKGAMQQFLKHGYAGTSMDKVAVAAGVSKATVYSKFQDKEGLFKELIEHLARRKFNLIFGTEPYEGEAITVLRQIGTRALEQMETDEEHCAFMRVLIGESGRFPELAQICVRGMMKPTFETLSQFMKAHPELKIKDPEAVARILVGTLVHFHLVQDVMHGKEIIPLSGDRVINAIMDLIVNSAKC